MMMDESFLKIMKMTDEEARERLEAIRWPEGAIICPKCGSVKGAYKLQSKLGTANPVRPGSYKCKDCRKKFTVTMGTIFEDTHIPLSKWLIAIYLMNASKKGMSAHQLHRMLDITYKTAWFMCHRIRLAMTDPHESPLGELMEGEVDDENIVEADEKYGGGKQKNKHEWQKEKGTQGRSLKTKTLMTVLVQRYGEVRVKVVKSANKATLQGNIRANVHPSARIHTDQWKAYKGLDKYFPAHEVVNHKNKEFARGDVTTNSAESFISLFSRGVYGTFHHISDKHYERYAKEFAFRWNHRHVTDGERTTIALAKTKGKRIMYKNIIKETDD